MRKSKFAIDQDGVKGESGETIVSWATMLKWCGKWGDDSRVLEWEKNNPQPAEWAGPPHSWAYTEMPVSVIGGGGE